MGLVNPLTIEMIQAANLIYTKLDNWQKTDQALIILRENLLGFTFEEILLKAVSVNVLYGANVYAIWKASEYIYNLMENIKPERVDTELVEKMAKVPGTNRRFTSFASKFAHFFISQEKFPIKDSFAEGMISYHLGSGNLVHFEDKPYCEYVTNLNNLKKLCGFNGSNQTFDRYLWLAGQYRMWRESNKEAYINPEVKLFFENHNNNDICLRAFYQISF